VNEAAPDQLLAQRASFERRRDERIDAAENRQARGNPGIERGGNDPGGGPQ
jgi:hypothetical protein